MRELVHSLKYRRNREVAVLFAGMLASHLATMHIVFSKDTALVPIPLHRARERIRGFNQSFLIAKMLGEKIGIEVVPDALQKIRKTMPQISLSREERLENLRDTFAVRNPLSVVGKTVVLVDDVKTTGATLEEAGRVLKQAGAKQIWAITVAH